MDANFYYYSIYDRFIERQPCGCVHLETLPLKNFPSETIDWTFAKFHSSVPKIEVKNFFSSLQKNQACGAIQALKRF